MKDAVSTHILEEIKQLSDHITDTSKRDIRHAKKRLKKQLHKHERNQNKRDLRQKLSGDEDD